MKEIIKKNNVYAVVVTFNPEKNLLLNQYNSLISQVSNIIYVDNGSTEIYTEHFAKCFTIENGENLGLGKAQNQGIQKAKKEGADFILLLDQDSILEDGMVDILLNEYYAYSKVMKIAAVGPVFKSGYDGSIKNIGITKVGLRIKKTKIIDTSQVSYIIASGSLIPISVFDEVGLINESLFIDALDVEWCLRAIYKGFVILQTDKTFLIHKLGNGNEDIVLSHSAIREYYIIRNSFVFIHIKTIPFSYKVRKLIYVIGRIIYSLIHGYFDYFKSSLKGIRDGVFWRNK